MFLLFVLYIVIIIYNEINDITKSCGLWPFDLKSMKAYSLHLHRCVWWWWVKSLALKYLNIKIIKQYCKKPVCVHSLIFRGLLTLNGLDLELIYLVVFLKPILKWLCQRECHFKPTWQEGFIFLFADLLLYWKNGGRIMLWLRLVILMDF